MGFLLLQSLKEVSTPTLFWASILIALALKYFILKPNNGKRKMNLPPAPPKLPIIGNLHQVGELPTASFHKLSQKYGPIMFLQLGEIPIVIISSPQMAIEVLKTHDLAFSTRAQIYAAKYLFYNYTDVAFAPYGAFWRSVRKLSVLELFSLRRVQQFAYVRAEEVGNLIRRIADSCASGPVNVSKNLDYYANDIMCRASVGKSFSRGGEFDKYGFQKLLESYMELLGGFTLGDYFPSFDFVRTLTGMKSRLLKTWRKFDQLWDEIISEHLNAERKPEDKKDLLDVLLDMHKNGAADVALTMDNIKAVHLDMFAAGTDTTFITLDWAMTELITHPVAMKKVQAEIRSNVGERRVVQEDDLPQMPYLKAIVVETPFIIYGFEDNKIN